MAPNKMYTRSAEPKAESKNDLGSVRADPIRGRKANASRNTGSTRNFAQISTATGRRASSAPPASAIGNTNGASGASAPISAPIPADGCPFCGSKPAGSQGVNASGKSPSKGGSGSKSPPPRRSPRKHPGSPPDGLIKRDGKIDGIAKIPQDVTEGRITKRFPKTRTRYSKGLGNLDNLACYRNAPLQCLLHIPAFYHYLGNMHKDCMQNTDSCTVCALQNLAHVYWNEGDEVQSRKTHIVTAAVVADFTAACRADAADLSLAMHYDFEGEQMSDPYEFTCFLSKAIKRAQTGQEIISCEAMFDTPRVQKWSCEECGYVNPTVGSGLDIGLETAFERLPAGAVSLTECLRLNTFQSEEARRCNGPVCVAKYGGGSDVTVKDENGAVVQGAVRVVKTTLTQLPEVLVIRIGIFKHNDKFTGARYTEGFYKDLRAVRTQEYLSLQPFSADDQDRFTYRLDGIVAHGGNGGSSSISGGHFVAAVRKVDGTTFDLMNDHRQIVPRRFDELRDKINVGTTRKKDLFDPYMLVYSRV